MGETKHDGLAIPGRAVLAREPAFSVGSVRVDPPTRQVIIGEQRRTIEPRVMQLLIVLAKARGAVVSREELIESCWGGRIVGDDAINHAIGKLRQLAAESDGAFAIETIARVGYRLVADLEPALAGVAERNDRVRPALTRRMVVGSGAALGVIAAAGGLFFAVGRGHRPSPLAKAYYDRGIATRAQGYATEYEQAVGYFRQAVDIDPEYADAWGALAWSYRVLLVDADDSDAPRLMALAKSAAKRSIALDAGNADARLALLLLRANYGRWAEVEQGCRRLLAQNPQHSITQFQLGFLLGDTGRWLEAIPHMQAVCDRQPTWPMARFRLFEELSNAGRVEEADSCIDEVMRFAPRNGDFWSSKIEHLLLTGRRAEAAAMLVDKAAWPLDDEQVVAQQSWIVDAFESASPVKRKSIAPRLLEAGAHPLYVAKVSSLLGELDTAFSLLDGVYFGRGPWSAAKDMRAPTHPLFSLAAAPLRADGRFERLLEETGLEAFWRDTNTAPDFRRCASV